MCVLGGAGARLYNVCVGVCVLAGAGARIYNVYIRMLAKLRLPAVRDDISTFGATFPRVAAQRRTAAAVFESCLLCIPERPMDLGTRKGT